MLRVHIRDDHRILGMNKYVQGIQNLGSYNCGFCDQTFEEEFGRMNHIQNFHFQQFNDLKILRPNVASGSRSAGMNGVQTEILAQQTYENQHFEQFELERNNRHMADEENDENELITSLNYFKRHAGTF